MGNFKKLGMAGALAATLAIVPGLGASSASAMPNVTSNSVNMAVQPDNIVQIRDRDRRHHGRRHDGRRHSKAWRRRHWRRHRGHYDNGWNPGAYIALGVIGALIDRGLSESSARSAMERCDRRYRSFEWDTGLYTTYGGDKRLCPYLR